MGHVTEYAGKMIYGVDFYIDNIDDNESHFWLQYENEENRLIVDNFGEIDLGLPKETHKLTENVSGINAFYGRSEYGQRTITLQTYWAKETDGGIISRRRKFLINFFTGKQEKLFFYMYLPQKMRRYRVEVKPSISGETYKNFVVNDNVSISLLCNSVFFESEEFVSVTKKVTSKTETEIKVFNEGFETSFIAEITPTEDFSAFQLSNAFGGAFKIQSVSNWAAGSHIRIDTGTAQLSVNGIEQTFGLSKGTFFNLYQGDNKLFYLGGKATVKILYKEKMK